LAPSSVADVTTSFSAGELPRARRGG